MQSLVMARLGPSATFAIPVAIRGKADVEYAALNGPAIG
jgi:hypothetical protein